MHLFFQSAIHFAVDVCHNVYHGHGIQAYIECIFLNFLTLCLASNDYFSLKLVASFVFVVVLLWFQPVDAPIPTPRDELVHFVISCVLHYAMGHYDIWAENTFVGIAMYTVHFVWQHDVNSQYFRFSMIAANFIHVVYWYLFDQTILGYIVSR